MIKDIVFPLVFTIVLCTACERKPFVEHKMKFEKVSDGCATNPQAFKMTSNFGGERYEFDRCLSLDFAKEQMMVSRQGDTVVVSFQKASASETSGIFNITLDIDSYPRYNFLTIDEDTYVIVASGK